MEKLSSDISLLFPKFLADAVDGKVKLRDILQHKPTTLKNHQFIFGLLKARWSQLGLDTLQPELFTARTSDIDNWSTFTMEPRGLNDLLRADLPSLRVDTSDTDAGVRVVLCVVSCEGRADISINIGRTIEAALDRYIYIFRRQLNSDLRGCDAAIRFIRNYTAFSAAVPLRIKRTTEKKG